MPLTGKLKDSWIRVRLDSRVYASILLDTPGIHHDERALKILGFYGFTMVNPMLEFSWIFSLCRSLLTPFIHVLLSVCLDRLKYRSRQNIPVRFSLQFFIHLSFVLGFPIDHDFSKFASYCGKKATFRPHQVFVGNN